MGAEASGGSAADLPAFGAETCRRRENGNRNHEGISFGRILAGLYVYRIMAGIRSHHGRGSIAQRLAGRREKRSRNDRKLQRIPRIHGNVSCARNVASGADIQLHNERMDVRKAADVRSRVSGDEEVYRGAYEEVVRRESGNERGAIHDVFVSVHADFQRPRKREAGGVVRVCADGESRADGGF